MLNSNQTEIAELLLAPQSGGADVNAKTADGTTPMEVSTDHGGALSPRQKQTDYLHQSQHHLIHAADYSKPGFCDHLNRYFDPATLMPEGMATR